FAIESAGEIPLAEFKPDDVVGIIAGASTPEWIIKEVVCRMSVLDMNEQVDEVMQEGAAAAEQEAVAQVDQPAEAAESEESQQDADFMQSVEETLRVLRKGQVLTGKIVQITENEVCVNIGYKSDGFIPKNEFSDDMDVDLRTVVNVGDEIDVCVLKVNDGEGNVLLSKKRVDSRKNWGTVMEMFKNNEYAEGVCKEVVKGGVIANILGIRAFIPASQLSQNYVENMQQFVGQTLQLKIIEVDEGRKRVVASRRAVLAEQAEAKKKEAWEKLTAGETILGTVKRITDFGAFVDVGGIDGLLHVTNMSWGRVNHPSDVVKPGDEIEVLILALDPEKERVSLGRKQLLPKPWEVAEQKYPVGSIVEGTVARIVSFGAFIELEPGLDGLVHISQIARHRIDKVEDVLEVGQKIQAKVLDVNTADKRISLSIRETLPEEEAPRYEDHEDSMEDSLYIPPQEETTFSLADFFPKQDD
ncbi:30S ribosomal protein S1, partial [Luoshenia tenuis]|uniref:30S ribosomal protein S1 n=2 Tax=Clostridia TaxID=186801 RepID=UPI003D8B85A5